MKYEQFRAAAILLWAATSSSMVVTTTADQTAGGTAEGTDTGVQHHWGVEADETYDGTSPIIIEPNDQWEAGIPYGNPWDPEAESTREGSGLGGNPPLEDLGNPNEHMEDIAIGGGNEVVSGPVMEVFEGRDVKESLAAEHGRGGGALGHARGTGRRFGSNNDETRNLRRRN